MAKVILITMAMNKKNVLKRLLITVAVVQLFQITINGQVCEPYLKFVMRDTSIIVYVDDVLLMDTVEHKIVLKEQVSDYIKKRQLFLTKIYYYDNNFRRWREMGIQHILDSHLCEFSVCFIAYGTTILFGEIINNSTLFYEGPLPTISP